MTVYRIVHRLVANLLEGSGNDGRWCAGGRKVIYTGSSISLACLENIIRRTGSGFSTDFRTIFYQIPDDMVIEEITLDGLPPDWSRVDGYPFSQRLGHKWYDKKDSLVLKVPSAMVPEEYNYVIKTTSPQIDKIIISSQKVFQPDERLEKLLMGSKV